MTTRTLEEHRVSSARVFDYGLGVPSWPRSVTESAIYHPENADDALERSALANALTGRESFAHFYAPASKATRKRMGIAGKKHAPSEYVVTLIEEIYLWLEAEYNFDFSTEHCGTVGLFDVATHMLDFAAEIEHEVIAEGDHGQIVEHRWLFHAIQELRARLSELSHALMQDACAEYTVQNERASWKKPADLVVAVVANEYANDPPHPLTSPTCESLSEASIIAPGAPNSQALLG